MKPIFFTPGPAPLYPGVERFIHHALRDSIPSISHRSKKYVSIHEETVENLRLLFGLPEDYYIFFHASATEIWERLIQNCVTKKSFHFVNGSFSERFYKTSLSLNREAIKFEKAWGKGFLDFKEEIPEEVEMINFTQNETSTGVRTPEPFIHLFKDQYPDALITVDMVSSAPIPRMDWKMIDAAYFSVQKCFGLPAGLGVLLLNEKCMEKARKRKAEGHSIGSYHSFTSQFDKYKVNQTVETPNVLGIYLLGKVLRSMLEKGLETIRLETTRKASKLYDYLDTRSTWSAFVADPELRSPTVVVANIPEGSDDLLQGLENNGFILGNGYGKMKGKQVRIANFPGVSLGQIEQLLIEMNKLS